MDQSCFYGRIFGQKDQFLLCGNQLRTVNIKNALACMDFLEGIFDVQLFNAAGKTCGNVVKGPDIKIKVTFTG